MVQEVNFTKSQSRLLNELKAKYEQAWQRDLNAALADIYDEQGLTEKVKDGKHRFILQPNFTGVTVSDAEPAPAIPGRKAKKDKAKKAE